jgi:phosphate starvation-inducible PhoH-like protein
MKETNRERKGEIKYNVTLNEEQKEATGLIHNNQIVIVTGRAGSGKSLVCARAALNFLMKKECEQIYVTRAAIEVGNSLGYLPGGLDDKFNPYLEAFNENLYKCYDKVKIDDFIKNKKIIAYPIQYIRGKTVDDILVVEEAQNLTKPEMLAILTRLGKTGKIIINGDLEQQDTRDSMTGLAYAIELSKQIEGIEWIKLKENHRSDLVGQILTYEYK